MRRVVLIVAFLFIHGSALAQERMSGLTWAKARIASDSEVIIRLLDEAKERETRLATLETEMKRLANEKAP